MTIFDEAVALLGRDDSARAMARDVGQPDHEATQVGVVLSLPIVVAGLDRWLPVEDRRDRMAQRLQGLYPDPDIADYPAMADRYDVETIGHELLSMLFGNRIDEVAGIMAGRAGLPVPAATRVLQVAAAAVQVRLAHRAGPAPTGDAVAVEVDDANDQLNTIGWEPWIAQTVGAVGVVPTLAGFGDLPVDAASPEATIQLQKVEVARPDLAPAAAEPAAAAPSLARSVVTPPSIDIAPLAAAPAVAVAPSTLVQPDADGGGAPVEQFSPEPEWHDERSSRRLLFVVAGVAVLAALAIAAGLFLTGDDGTTASEGTSAATPTTVDAALAPEAQNDEETDGAGTTDDAGVDPDGSVDAAPLAAREISVDLIDPLARSEASGVATILFDPAQEQICFEFDTDGLSERYDGHIHVGPAGVKGGIVVDYGELSGATEDCLAISTVDINAILADPAGHYVEFHDDSEAFTIRAQLDDATTSPAVTEADPDGAYVVIGQESLILRGEVADEVAREKMAESFDDISLDGIEIVDELEVVPGSPRPSGRIVIDDSILFAVDSDRLADLDSTVIANVAAIFRARPAWSMVIIGHTDDIGPEVYNLELSLRRAEAVREALIGLDVPSEALSIEGAGDTDPIADNDTAEGRARNRRIEFVVTAG